MSGPWFFGLAGAINLVSVILLVLSVRERRRIEDVRRRMRVERRRDGAPHVSFERPSW